MGKGAMERKKHRDDPYSKEMGDLKTLNDNYAWILKCVGETPKNVEELRNLLINALVERKVNLQLYQDVIERIKKEEKFWGMIFQEIHGFFNISKNPLDFSKYSKRMQDRNYYAGDFLRYIVGNIGVGHKAASMGRVKEIIKFLKEVIANPRCDLENAIKLFEIVKILVKKHNLLVDCIAEIKRDIDNKRSQNTELVSDGMNYNSREQYDAFLLPRAIPVYVIPGDIEDNKHFATVSHHTLPFHEDAPIVSGCDAVNRRMAIYNILANNPSMERE